MKWLITLSVVVASALLSEAFSPDACKWPVQLWCSDTTIAAACGVLWQCNAIEAARTRYASGVFDNAAPVSLGFYIESLCPDCREFITDQVMPTWNKISNIMNVTMVPYGNAKETFQDGHWQFTCQHGADECLGNVIETCAINLYTQASAFAFIGCIEASSITPVEQAAQKCASQQPELDFARIMKCAQSQEGELLEHNMALLTDALDPPHWFVPWVTLNGVHNDDIQNRAQSDLLGLVCDTYQGPKPDACTKHVSGCSRNAVEPKQRPILL